jgi:hypothetical protein
MAMHYVGIKKNYYADGSLPCWKTNREHIPCKMIILITDKHALGVLILASLSLPSFCGILGVCSLGLFVSVEYL